MIQVIRLKVGPIVPYKTVKNWGFFICCNWDILRLFSSYPNLERRAKIQSDISPVIPDKQKKL